MFKPCNFRHLKSVPQLSTLAPSLSEERINLGTYHAPLIKKKGRGWPLSWDTCGHFHLKSFTGEDRLCLSGKADREEKEEKKERKREVVFLVSKDGNRFVCHRACSVDEFVQEESEVKPP